MRTSRREDVLEPSKRKPRSSLARFRFRSDSFGYQRRMPAKGRCGSRYSSVYEYRSRRRYMPKLLRVDTHARTDMQRRPGKLRTKYDIRINETSRSATLIMFDQLPEVRLTIISLCTPLRSLLIIGFGFLDMSQFIPSHLDPAHQLPNLLDTWKRPASIRHD